MMSLIMRHNQSHNDDVIMKTSSYNDVVMMALHVRECINILGVFHMNILDDVMMM